MATDHGTFVHCIPALIEEDCEQVVMECYRQGVDIVEAYTTLEYIAKRLRDSHESEEYFMDNDKLYRRIKNKKPECEHDWQYDGHGHNSDYERCSKCGEIRDV